MIALLLATGCAAAPSTPVPPSTTQSAASDFFPEPKSGISIQIAPGEPMTVDQLLAEFARVTGLHLVLNKEVATIVKMTPTGLLGSVEIPATEVYPFVEGLLSHNDFVLTPLTGREPRLVAVDSLSAGGQRGGSLRNGAIFVPVESVPAYARHPAVLITTVINLPSVDVRTLSNSMRTMFTDANTQQIIPVGNSNSLVLTGFGAPIAGLVVMLQRIEEDARRDAEAAAKKTPPPPAPPPAEPPR